MNKDNAHEYLPLVQALADGKTIQLKCHDGKFYDTDVLKETEDVSDYRIKPDPRTFDLWRNINTGLFYPTTYPDFNYAASPNYERITVQEVLQ